MILINEDYLMHHGVKGMKWGVRHDRNARKAVRNTVGDKSGHYSRNKKNTNLPQNSKEAKERKWIKESKKKSSMHQFYLYDNKRNEKWISPDGKKEVVFSGKGEKQHITNHDEDMGTYNFANPKKRPLGHALFDTIPYIALGNSKKDTTSVGERLINTYKSFKYSDINLDDLDDYTIKYGRRIINEIDEDD